MQLSQQDPRAFGAFFSVGNMSLCQKLTGEVVYMLGICSSTTSRECASAITTSRHYQFPLPKPHASYIQPCPCHSFRLNPPSRTSWIVLLPPAPCPHSIPTAKRDTPHSISQRLAGVTGSLIPLLPEQRGASALMLSSDELCLAVLTGRGHVICYSLPALMQSKISDPNRAAAPSAVIVSASASTEVTHFAWCKGSGSASQASSFLYVTLERDLFVGLLGQPDATLVGAVQSLITVMPNPVQCFSVVVCCGCRFQQCDSFTSSGAASLVFNQ